MYKTILASAIRRLNFNVNEEDRISYEDMLSTYLSKSKSRQLFINYFVDKYLKNYRPVECSSRRK